MNKSIESIYFGLISRFIYLSLSAEFVNLAFPNGKITWTAQLLDEDASIMNVYDYLNISQIRDFIFRHIYADSSGFKKHNVQ